MGEHEAWSHPGDLLLNGLLSNEVGNATRLLDEERWAKAEERTAELLACIQPNRPSEERRNAVANYVQKLIMKCFSCEVFTFGSVPLKTYLPDGDIDLTAFNKNENLKDNWANEVREVLENEERSESAEFRVKEVQYIQAEVKIIKCLVENIVVDISFNQVGGLCTLCFLEEIDHLINRNHLFKRSIILIKAWCYYESRILGAHHGLISTYALETLVLYIFHVFNNSLNGPLEVLYRFLEFFSHFDWDNFCVSLWGPVPISSLPDMSAESPRKDGGKLLLSGLFLEACSSVYAVFPVGQESQGQQFVSKHFNVIDPLRTNNNLGRSVSKGNFYRIRSAFAFGAKRLARLLDCPKENLITEVNQFFTNTWERHGSGNRPDVPSPQSLRPLMKGSAEESNNSRGTASLTKSTESIGLQVGLEHQPKGSLAFNGSVSQALNTTASNAHRTSNSSIVSRAPGQKGNANQISSRDSDHLERNPRSGTSVKSDKNQKILRPNHTDFEGRGSFQFSRTQSSPELTETSVDAPSRIRHGRVAEASKTFNEHLRSEYGSRRKNINSEVSSIQSASSSFDDPSFHRQSSSQQSLEAATNSNCASNSYHDDAGFTSVGEELASVSDALELQQQEQQDMINMMASSRVHNFIGQVQLPMHFTSPHPPLSPYLASMGYAQRNWVTLIDPSWGSTMQFPQGFVSSQPHYFPNANNLKSNSDELETCNETPRVNAVSAEDEEHDVWHYHDVGFSRGFETDIEDQMLRSNERQHSSPSPFTYVPSSAINNFGTSVIQGHQKFATENKGSRDDYQNTFQQQTSGTNDMIVNDRNANLRHIPMMQISSARSNLYSETSRDGPNAKPSKLTRNKWGRSQSTSEVANSPRGKAKTEWHYEVASEPATSSQEDDESGRWVSTSTSSTTIAEHAITSTPLMSVHSRSQLSGYEHAQISGADSMIPFPPVLVGGSRQKLGENSGVIPFTFYPTGPPVPFVTMVPVYNFPADGANADGSINQVDKDDDAEHPHASQSDQNLDSVEKYDQFDGLMNLSTSKGAALGSSDEHKPDILNSDFASHWRNLQFGRFCQNTRNHGPFTYSPPVMVPPVYLQGHFPMDGPGRPHSANINFPQVMGYGPRLVPVNPLQPGPSRPSGVFHRYGDDSPRYRSGTGTYLPNPKAPFRERQYSNARNHRGSYKHDRGDQADREGSWINAKARSAGRGHARNQNERSNFRSDRLAASENRQWDSYRHEQFGPHQVQNHSFRPSNLPNDSVNLPYGVYPLPGGGSNGVGSTVPSVVMLYPYEQGVNCGAPAESLEFGSFGPVHLSNNEGPRPNDGNPMKRIHDPRHNTNRGGSPRSSPD